MRYRWHIEVVGTSTVSRQERRGGTRHPILRGPLLDQVEVYASGSFLARVDRAITVIVR